VYAYDAYVLHAARISGARLLTLDRRMEEVAGRIGVPVIEVVR
jgi:rRNA-processing protein FCF1